jgi:uncharacterized membrane protein
MATCSKCGSAVTEGTSFCSVCGSPVASTSGPIVIPSPPESKPPESRPPGSGSVGMESNVAAALAYLLGFVTGIIFLVLEPYKKDPLVRFHAFQSIFFSAGAIVFSIFWNIVHAVMYSIFGLLGVLFSLIGVLIGLGFFLYWLFLMYKAYNKERYLIPVIGEFAQKQVGKEF